MHSVGVLHRDLKPGNILISKDWQVRITDFGLSRYQLIEEDNNDNNNTMTEYVVTRWYRAPELLLSPNSCYSEKIDMWSIGCILAELSLRQPIFPGNSHPNQIRRIFEIIGYDRSDSLKYDKTIPFLKKYVGFESSSIETILTKASIESLSLIKLLLSIDPMKRPSAKESLNHEFLKHILTEEYYLNSYVATIDPIEFSFENNENTIQELREMIINEIELVKSKNLTDEMKTNEMKELFEK